MPARALWKAILEAGPLRVPVRMYTAVRPNELRFRMLHDQDQVPLRQVLECPVEQKEVPREHAVRGFEVREDEYVVMSEEELDGCGPVPGRVIAVRQFVDPADVDPLFLDKPYYLGPDAGGEREYAALLRAMVQTGKAGVAEYVLRGKQYVALLRPRVEPAGGERAGESGGDADGESDGTPKGESGGAGGRVLCLVTMRYADAVLAPAAVAAGGDAEAARAAREAGKARAAEREVRMAEQLVEALSSGFDPSQYRDEYRSCVMSLIETKAAGRPVPARKPADKPATRAPDLADVLRASLERVKAGGHVPERGGAGAKRLRAVAEPPRPPAGRNARKRDRSRAGGG